MKYMLLIYHDEPSWAAVPEAISFTPRAQTLLRRLNRADEAATD
jgi:hypothetical protein